MEALSQSAQHDFYHLPEYHALEEERQGATAFLFAYGEGRHRIALPLLLRPIDQVAGLEETARGLQDATSVYGYAGPVAGEGELPETMRADFRQALLAALAELRVVAVFSRLHPLLSQTPLLAGLGECHATGQTISIDLTLPPDRQRAQYRRTYVADIKQLHQRGVTCDFGGDDSFLQEFIDIYYETMERVGASATYFFERGYFERLLAIPGSRVHVGLARKEGAPIGAALLTVCDGIVQHHLAGTRTAYTRISPMKLVIDAARCWANDQGLRVYHHGGGLGAREDSLFHFKAGFSNRRHPFFTWRWRVDPGLYERLCAKKHRWNQEHGLASAASGYFPEYRAPTVAGEQASSIPASAPDVTRASK